MSKKSNKTEQVLKLITRDDESFKANNGVNGQEENSVEINVKQAEKQQNTIETKLKIEIEPEFEIKPAKNQAEDLTVQIPVKNNEKPKAEGNTVTEPKRCLINLTERLVKEKAAEVMKKMNVCGCETCGLDVLALALNSLQNKYVTTDAGRQHLLLNIYQKQYETDIVAALTKACVRVKVSPRHGE